VMFGLYDTVRWIELDDALVPTCKVFASMVAAQSILTHVSVMAASQGGIVPHQAALSSVCALTAWISREQSSNPPVILLGTLSIIVMHWIIRPNNFNSTAMLQGNSKDCTYNHHHTIRITSIPLADQFQQLEGLRSYPERHRMAIPTTLHFPD
jgi:hypothetical protein